MRKGHLSAIVDVADEECYKGYIARTPGVIKKLGGRFVSRGSVFKVLEGGLAGKRVVVDEFDSPETVDRFDQSEVYLPIKHFRTDAPTTQNSSSSAVPEVCGTEEAEFRIRHIGRGHLDGGSGIPLRDAAWRGCLLRFDAESFRFTRFAEEAQGWAVPSSVARAVRKRQAEYFHGRAAARHALRALGVDCPPLPMGDDGAPRWPAGLVGSISHCDGVAVAIAGYRTGVCGVGVDVERIARAENLVAIEQVALDDDERALVASQRSWVAADALTTALFSAKESLYKALRPSVGRFFGFEAARVVALDPAVGLLRLRLEEPLGPSFGAGSTYMARFGLIDDETLITVVAA